MSNRSSRGGSAFGGRPTFRGRRTVGSGTRSDPFRAAPSSNSSSSRSTSRGSSGSRGTSSSNNASSSVVVVQAREGRPGTIINDSLTERQVADFASRTRSGRRVSSSEVEAALKRTARERSGRDVFIQDNTGRSAVVSPAVAERIELSNARSRSFASSRSNTGLGGASFIDGTTSAVTPSGERVFGGASFPSGESVVTPQGDLVRPVASTADDFFIGDTVSRDELFTPADPAVISGRRRNPASQRIFDRSRTGRFLRNLETSIGGVRSDDLLGSRSRPISERGSSNDLLFPVAPAASPFVQDFVLARTQVASNRVRGLRTTPPGRIARNAAIGGAVGLGGAAIIGVTGGTAAPFVVGAGATVGAVGFGVETARPELAADNVGFGFGGFVGGAASRPVSRGVSSVASNIRRVGVPTFVRNTADSASQRFLSSQGLRTVRFQTQPRRLNEFDLNGFPEETSARTLLRDFRSDPSLAPFTRPFDSGVAAAPAVSRRRLLAGEPFDIASDTGVIFPAQERFRERILRPNGDSVLVQDGIDRGRFVVDVTPSIRETVLFQTSLPGTSNRRGRGADLSGVSALEAEASAFNSEQASRLSSGELPAFNVLINDLPVVGNRLRSPSINDVFTRVTAAQQAASGSAPNLVPLSTSQSSLTNFRGVDLRRSFRPVSQQRNRPSDPFDELLVVQQEISDRALRSTADVSQTRLDEFRGRSSRSNRGRSSLPNNNLLISSPSDLLPAPSNNRLLSQIIPFIPLPVSTSRNAGGSISRFVNPSLRFGGRSSVSSRPRTSVSSRSSFDVNSFLGLGIGSGLRSSSAIRSNQINNQRAPELLSLSSLGFTNGFNVDSSSRVSVSPRFDVGRATRSGTRTSQDTDSLTNFDFFGGGFSRFPPPRRTDPPPPRIFDEPDPRRPRDISFPQINFGLSQRQPQISRRRNRRSRKDPSLVAAFLDIRSGNENNNIINTGINIRPIL